jgi:hypothetical protein
MKEQTHLAGIGCFEPDAVERVLATREGGALVDWQALAERRLAKLTAAGHELAVARDALDRLQAEHRELIRQAAELARCNVQQQRRIEELEGELHRMHTSRSWRWTVPIRWLATHLRRVKAAV